MRAGAFQQCLTGPYTVQDVPECQRCGYAGDLDVDLDDAARFVGCLSGPGVAADSACMP